MPTAARTVWATRIPTRAGRRRRRRQRCTAGRRGPGEHDFYDAAALNGYTTQYSINSRAKAQVVAENNYWKLPSGGKVAKLLSGDGTGAVKGSGNLVNGTPTDLVAAYNAASSKDLKTTVNWTPTLTAGLESSARNLPTTLSTTTGAGVLK